MQQKLRIVLYFYVHLFSWCAADIFYQIQEELPRDTLIGDILQDSGLAYRYDQEDLDRIRLSILTDQGPRPYFSIEENSGIFKTASKLDRDSICPLEDICIVSVSVAISPAQFFDTFNIEVELLDLNDNAPAFEVPLVFIALPESSRPGKVISLPQAYDPDTTAFAIRSYELVSREDIPFLLESSVALDGTKELRLELRSAIDREVTSFYFFEIVAEDGGNPSRRGTLQVNITVEDTNDHVPVFERQSYETDFPENAAVGTTILTLRAYDVDIGLNGQIIFALARRTYERYGSLFGIRENTGELYIKGTLDYETETIYHLVITATDRGLDTQTSQTTVTVHVTDINDFVPAITVNTLTATGEAQVLEHVVEGTFVAHVRVVDRDSGEAGQVVCGLDNDLFQLHPLDEPLQFTIVTNTIFNREQRSVYSVSLRCRDNGDLSLSSGYNLTVHITDANDHAPRFTKSLYSANIEENGPVDEFVLRVEATDSDIGENANLNYFLSDNNPPEIAHMFKMEVKTGVLRTRQSLDHERNKTLNLEILVRDSGNPVQSSIAQVSLSVLDVNDCAPIFGQAGYSFGIYENRLAGEDAGNVVATDQDSEPFDIVSYTIEPVLLSDYDIHNKFRIDSQTGYMFTRIELDREERDKYFLKVVAYNLGYNDMSSTASVTIYVADVNDNSPEFIFPTAQNNTVTIPNTAQIDTVVARLRAQDADMGDNAKVSFNLLDGADDKFLLDRTNGILTVNTDLTDQIGVEFNLTVEAEDHGDPARRQSAILVIAIQDGSAPWDLSSGGNKKGKGDSQTDMSNFGIVIGVACGSIIVIALLALAIIILSCKGHKQARKSDNAQGQYNCRMNEAQRMLTRAENRSSSESSAHGSPVTSPSKSGKEPVLSSEDVKVIVSSNLASRNQPISGSTPAINVTAYDKASWMSSPSVDGARSLPRGARGSRAPPTSSSAHAQCDVSGVPLGVCNGCVTASPQQSRRRDKLTPNLVPVTDKEMEMHKVLRFLHSQQDDAESGCSETLSTSDSGRGNSVSEDMLDHAHPLPHPPPPPHRVGLSCGSTSASTTPSTVSAAASASAAAGNSAPKQVHFMHIPSSPYGSQRQLDGADNSHSPYSTAGSNGSLNTVATARPHVATTLSSLNSALRTPLSTFTSPNARAGIVKHSGQDHSGSNTAPRRQPARVSFQCPPYDTHTYSLPGKTRQHGGRAIIADVGKGGPLQVPMGRIDELCSAENLSDDSASTTSGSYVLQHEDPTHSSISRREHSPMTIPAYVCRVLPTIQDSIV